MHSSRLHAYAEMHLKGTPSKILGTPHMGVGSSAGKPQVPSPWTSCVVVPEPPAARAPIVQASQATKSAIKAPASLVQPQPPTATAPRLQPTSSTVQAIASVVRPQPPAAHAPVVQPTASAITATALAVQPQPPAARAPALGTSRPLSSPPYISPGAKAKWMAGIEGRKLVRKAKRARGEDDFAIPARGPPTQDAPEQQAASAQALPAEAPAVQAAQVKAAPLHVVLECPAAQEPMERKAKRPRSEPGHTSDCRAQAPPMQNAPKLQAAAAQARPGKAAPAQATRPKITSPRHPLDKLCHDLHARAPKGVPEPPEPITPSKAVNTPYQPKPRRRLKEPRHVEGPTRRSLKHECPAFEAAPVQSAPEPQHAPAGPAPAVTQPGAAPAQQPSHLQRSESDMDIDTEPAQQNAFAAQAAAPADPSGGCDLVLSLNWPGGCLLSAKVQLQMSMFQDSFVCVYLS